MNTDVESLENEKLVESDIKIIGDKSTVCQIVMLIAYIRNAIANKQQKDIQVKVGSKVNSDFFAFQVNGQQIADRIAKDYIEIN